MVFFVESSYYNVVQLIIKNLLRKRVQLFFLKNTVLIFVNYLAYIHFDRKSINSSLKSLNSFSKVAILSRWFL